MWIDRFAFCRLRDAARRQSAPTYFAGVLLILLAGCGGESGDVGETAGDVAVAEPEPAAEAPVTTVADLFPAAPEKEMVLNSCATCHAVACAAMGQRSANRWQELASGHREHVPALSDADRERIFAYLSTNFNETRPEPTIPPEFLDRGCTPF